MSDSVYSTFLSTVARSNSQVSNVWFWRDHQSKESRSGSMNSDIQEFYSSVFSSSLLNV